MINNVHELFIKLDEMVTFFEHIKNSQRFNLSDTEIEKEVIPVFIQLKNSLLNKKLSEEDKAEIAKILNKEKISLEDLHKIKQIATFEDSVSNLLAKFSSLYSERPNKVAKHSAAINPNDTYDNGELYSDDDGYNSCEEAKKEHAGIWDKF